MLDGVENNKDQEIVDKNEEKKVVVDDKEDKMELDVQAQVQEEEKQALKEEPPKWSEIYSKMHAQFSAQHEQLAKQKEEAGNTHGKYEYVLPLGETFSHVAQGENAISTHRLSAKEAAAQRYKSEGLIDNAKRKVELNKEVYEALDKKYNELVEQRRQYVESKTAEKKSEQSSEKPTLTKEQQEFERSISRTEAKDKADEKFWAEEEKAYTRRDDKKESAKVIEAWKEIVSPPPPKEFVKISEEEKAKQVQATRLAASEFVKKEKTKLLARDHKELSRDLKSEMRGLNPTTRETMRPVDPEKKPLRPTLMDVPPMHILPKAYLELSPSEVIRTFYSAYQTERQERAKKLTPTIVDQKDEALKLHQRWHELMHPLEDAARQKALATPGVIKSQKKQDFPPASAKVSKGCEGALVEGEKIPEGKSGRPVVTGFLKQRAFELEPFHKMLRSHVQLAEQNEKEANESKAKQVNDINTQMRKLTIKG